MIDMTLLVGDIQFCTHHERALYISTSNADRQRWLEDNKGKWQRIEDLQQELAPMAAPPGDEASALLAGMAKADARGE
jgi:hypothetical protein